MKRELKFDENSRSKGSKEGTEVKIEGHGLQAEDVLVAADPLRIVQASLLPQ